VIWQMQTDFSVLLKSHLLISHFQTHLHPWTICFSGSPRQNPFNVIDYFKRI
jgi:hypothetical protein